MYKLLLIFKYLRRKLAPLFAAVAVVLCTAMVIIVMSVMGGFLEEFRSAARKLTGDVVVRGALQGFDGYEELMQRLEELPEVAVSMPMIEGHGLLNFGEVPKPVLVQGIDFEKFEAIVGYKDTLLWDPADVAEEMRLPDNDRGNGVRRQIMRGHPIDPVDDDSGTGLPEALIGVEVNPYQGRDDEGNYVGTSWAGLRAALTVVPLTERGTVGTLEPERRELLVVNEFKSGLYDIDSMSVLVPFETLQRMLKMDERRGFTDVDPETGLGGEETVIPGRVNRLVLKAAEGFTPDQARDAAEAVIFEFYAQRYTVFVPRAYTWEELHAQIIGAVEKEKNLVTFLFAIISVVAIFMVATTFYTLIQDKTRDIGVLRAIGARRLGILGLFIGYGLMIGVIGAGLGALLAYTIVRSLNGVQFFLGHYLGVTSLLAVAALLGLLLGLLIAVVVGFRQRRMMYWLRRLPIAGLLLFLLPTAGAVLFVQRYAVWLNENISFVMWDPQTYMFDRIPDRLDPLEIGLIVAGMVVSCVVGSLIPALVASSLEPVETLRYE